MNKSEDKVRAIIEKEATSFICNIFSGEKRKNYLCKIEKRLNELKPSYTRGKRLGYIAFTAHKFNHINGQTTHRIITKTSKFIHNRIFYDLSNSGGFISDVTRKINKSLFKDNKPDIIILEGINIPKAYRDCIGGSSCMTGSTENTMFYSHNPDKIKLLTLQLIDGSARCLLWRLDCGYFYADKIYSDCDYAENLLIDFIKGKIKSENWLAYFRKNDSTSDLLKVSGLKFYKDELMPFLDTFYYLELIDNLLNLSYLKINSDNVVTLTDDGYIDFGTACDNCGVYYDENDMYIIDGYYYCDNCTFICRNCDEITPIYNFAREKFGHSTLCEACFHALGNKPHCVNEKDYVIDLGVDNLTTGSREEVQIPKEEDE